MENYKVKDIKLAEQGEGKIYWAEQRMPVLALVRKRFEKEKPLKGLTVGLCLHVTKETAVLIKTLAAGGAKIASCGCNPLSTQDDVAAALAKEGYHVYAWREQNDKEYYECLNKVLDYAPDVTIDDGGDLVFTVHTKRQECLKKMKGGCEETTTGVIRLNVMEKEGALKYPVMDVNDAYTKYLFDNRYGTGQSTLDGIVRATNVLISGKTFVVGGYGWCGRGLAMRAKGMGANVVVTEVDPVRALEAVMEGYRVMPMAEAAKIGDIFVTVTGDKDIITKEHFGLLKDGAILSNSGHFNVEIDGKALEEMAVSKKTVRTNAVEYTLPNKRRVYLLAEGRLVNLAAAEGHPSEVMDLSFANEALSVEYIAKNHGKMTPKVYRISEAQDKEIASLKLESMGIKIDKLSEAQKKYLSSWKEGT
jgi:adenosylhomocysteinase